MASQIERVKTVVTPEAAQRLYKIAFQEPVHLRGEKKYFTKGSVGEVLQVVHLVRSAEDFAWQQVRKRDVHFNGEIEDSQHLHPLVQAANNAIKQYSCAWEAYEQVRDYTGIEYIYRKK